VELLCGIRVYIPIRQLTFDVKTRYAEVGERRKLHAIERLIVISQESLKLTEARVTEGDVARLDRDLLRVELSRTDALRSTVSGRAESALIELRQLAALDVSNLTVFNEPDLPAPALALEDLKQQASGARPDLKRARVGEEQAAAAVSLAEAEAKPDVTLSARDYSRHGCLAACHLQRTSVAWKITAAF